MFSCLRGAINQAKQTLSTPSTRRRCMAWRCSGRTNEELVENLFSGKFMYQSRRKFDDARLMTDERVKKAMLAVDRADYSPRDAYHDSPQTIGWAATISAPHMHAAALEGLKNHLVEGARALDVGSGSGYLTACMAKMVGTTGKVVGVEHIGELVELSKKNIRKHDAHLLDSGVINIVEGDGRLGYAAEQPYNAIHVGAAAESVPKALSDQLAEGGRMLIPVGKEHGGQVFLQVDKIDGQLTQKVVEHVIYVPLTDKQHQLGRQRN